MSTIWEKLTHFQINLINEIEKHLEEHDEPGLERFNRPEDGWLNLVWNNRHVRRAHMDVVDARKKKGLWMMHVCIMPAHDNDAPIYGFDVIAGENKITGAFHDFSETSMSDHPLMEWYEESIGDFKPKKERNLPEWARNIFSDNMIAASNVRDDEEIDKILELALKNLKVYLESIHEYTGFADPVITKACHQYYAENQRQNPHTPRVMKSLGLSDEDVEVFCKDVLFPDT